MRKAEDFTEEELDTWRCMIDDMSQEECARMWRYTPTGHPYFRSDLPLHEYFKEHFKQLGGMTPEVSKAIG